MIRDDNAAGKPDLYSVAEVCFSRSWGGLEHYCAEMALRLSSRGMRVVPIVSPGSPIDVKLKKAGLRTLAISTRNYLSPLATLHLTKYFRTHSIDALHLHRTQDLGVVLPAAEAAGIPIRVLTLQMESDRRKKDIYHRWIYNKLSLVLTITERMRRLVTENVAVNPSKVKVLYYGVDCDKLNAEAEPQDYIRWRWNIPGDAFVVGLVGRIEPSKGQEILLRAAASLQDRIPGLVLMFVGDETIGQSGEKARLRKLAERLIPAVPVIFTGYQSPPGGIVPAFDISVLASRKETFGLVVIEAMALGIPVIATNAGGVPEIVEEGRTGLLVPPEDPPALAAAILRLYRAPQLRRVLSEAGISQTRAKFGMDIHLLNLERYLRGDSQG